MNEVIETKIENLIYEIRGKAVMLDSDIARLFKYETKNLNRQVMRNSNRFPENYCFQLTEDEYKNLRCQNVTSNSKNYGGRRYLPYVFTEYRITMLAGVLKSDVAVEASLRIVNTFIFMRKYISTNLIQQKYINDMVLEDHDKILLNQIEHKNKYNEIYVLSTFALLPIDYNYKKTIEVLKLKLKDKYLEIEKT